MAFLSEYAYDIFISYAHVDNLTVNSDATGWVDQFDKHLTLGLGRRIGRMGRIKIWRDERLDGSQLFDEVIKKRIEQSAIFLALNSAGYVESEYCQQELQHFYQKCQSEKTGLDIDDQRRILNILLNNIPYDQWPAEFGRTSGFPFHEPEAEEKFCYPLDPTDKHFDKNIKKLVEAIYSILTAFSETAGEPDSPAKLTESGEQKGACDVFLATVADSLKLTRKRVINDLNDKGLKVCEKIPPPYEAQQHEQAVISSMQKAKICIHLLDNLGGAEIEGLEETTYPQRQVQLGRENSKNQLIWLPRNLNFADIEDDAHRTLLEELENSNRDEAGYEFIRGMPNEIVRSIKEKLDLLKSQADSATVQRAVLLDTHIKDQLVAFQMSQFLFEKNIQPYINPEDDDPVRNIQFLQERLKQVEALIIFFGQVGVEWVRARLAEAIKIVVTGGYPIKAFFVYMAPPETEKDALSFEQPFLNLHLLDNRKGFNPDSLGPLFEELGKGAAG